MSSGISDANAVGNLGNDVLEAVYNLRDAIKAADAGHRGIVPLWHQRANAILEEAGYELRKTFR